MTDAIREARMNGEIRKAISANALLSLLEPSEQKALATVAHLQRFAKGQTKHRRASQRRETFAAYDHEQHETRPMAGDISEQIDVLVIGAGQAGLAVGRWLSEAGVSFTLIDGKNRIGDSWRSRYDLLVLFSSRAYSALPGLLLTGDPAGYPHKDEIADYLERYAQVMRLPMLLNEQVTSLTRTDRGFVAHTASARRFGATCVIIAAGPFQRPIIPRFAEKLSADVVQLDGTTYRSPHQIPAGWVLVVGMARLGGK